MLNGVRHLEECQFLIDIVWMCGFCMLCRLCDPSCCLRSTCCVLYSAGSGVKKGAGCFVRMENVICLCRCVLMLS